MKINEIFEKQEREREEKLKESVIQIAQDKQTAKECAKLIFRLIEEEMTEDKIRLCDYSKDKIQVRCGDEKIHAKIFQIMKAYFGIEYNKRWRLIVSELEKLGVYEFCYSTNPYDDWESDIIFYVQKEKKECEKMNENEKKRCAIYPNMFKAKSDGSIVYAMLFTGTDENIKAMKVAFEDDFDFSKLNKDDVVVITKTERKIMSYCDFVENYEYVEGVK